MFTVFINNIEFYAYHGVSGAEQEIGHRYVMTLSMLVNGKATISDHVKDTVDYGLAAEIAVDAATSESFFTVERVAQLVAEALLDKFRSLDEVEITLEKLAPPMALVCESAGVTVRIVR